MATRAYCQRLLPTERQRVKPVSLCRELSGLEQSPTAVDSQENQHE